MSPLSFLFLLTFSYLSHPSSSPLPLPLPSFRGPLIHLLSTYSLINMSPLCLRPVLSLLLCRDVFFNLPHFILTFSASCLSVFLSLFFFLIDEFQEGSSPSLLRLCYLQADNLSVWKPAGLRDPFSVWMCELLYLDLSCFSTVSFSVSLCVGVWVCVYQPSGSQAVVLVSESLAGSHAGFMGCLCDSH